MKLVSQVKKVKPRRTISQGIYSSHNYYSDGISPASQSLVASPAEKQVSKTCPRCAVVVTPGDNIPAKRFKVHSYNCTRCESARRSKYKRPQSKKRFLTNITFTVAMKLAWMQILLKLMPKDWNGTGFKKTVNQDRNRTTKNLYPSL